MKCKDPSTWPEPSTEYACDDAGYGAVRVRAWAKMHPNVRAHEGQGSRGPLPIVVGTLVLVEVERLPRGKRWREPKKLWLWWDGPGEEEPDLDLLWRAYTSGALTWSTPSASSSRPWDGPHLGCAIPSRPTGGRGWWWPLSPRAQAGTGRRCGPEAALGETLRHRSSDTDPDPPRRFSAFSATRHTRQAAKTLRTLTGTAQRAPLGPSQALPGLQEDYLSLRRP
jgi:hypothetical protein